MADRQLYIEIVVDDHGAVQKFAQIDNAAMKIGKTGKDAAAGMGELEKAVVASTAAGAFLGTVAVDLARGALTAVKDAIFSVVGAAAQYNATMTGLSTVAKSFSVDTNAAQQAAVSLASDGLMTVGEAAAGLKNLLAAGFGLPEAIQLMRGFKDSAAFNRQASLEFGQAVVSATEGIKNQNSILVDNAGLTKNLSVIMKEAGLSVSDLARVSSDAGVRAKFLAGLMKELNTFTGDAARMADQYAGKVAALNTNFTMMQVELGQKLLPVASKFIDVLNLGISAIKVAPGAVMGMVGALGALAASLLVTTALQKYNESITAGTALMKGWANQTLVLAQHNGLAGGMTSVWADKLTLLNSAIAAFMAYQLGDYIGKLILKITGAAESQEKWHAIMRSNPFTLLISHIARYYEETGKASLETEMASYRTEQLGRASQIAGRQVTSMAEAVQILADAARKSQDPLAQSRNMVLKYGEALGSQLNQIAMNARLSLMASEATERYKREVGSLNDTALAKLKTMLEDNRFSLKQLADQTGISEASLKELKQIVDQEAQSQKKAATEAQKHTDELKKQREEIQKRVDALTGRDKIDAAWQALDDVNRALKEGVPITKMTIEAQAQLHKTLEAAIEVYHALGLKAPIEMIKVWQATMPPLPVITGLQGLNDLLKATETGLGNITLAAYKVPPAVSGIGNILDQLPGKLDLSKIFQQPKHGLFDGFKGMLSKDLPQVIIGALQGGGDVAKSVGGLFGQHLGQNISNMAGDFLGKTLGKSVGGAIGSIIPGLGTMVGGFLGDKIGGWISGLFGGKGEGRKLVEEFAQSMGGFDALQKKLAGLGADGERLWKNLTQGVGKNNPKEAKRAIDAITKAFADQEQKIRDVTEGTERFLTGATRRVDAFYQQVARAKAQVEKELGGEATGEALRAGILNTLGGTQETIQAEFTQLGLYAGTAFATTLKEKGWMQAIADAGPMFDQLIELQNEFGLSVGEGTQQFLDFYKAAKDNADVMAALDGLTQMIKGAGQATFLNQELFNAFSTDAITQYTRLTERGVAANDAMILMQPTLQALWEAQQKYKFETDEATQALIDQGIEQGIIGERMKDVNQKILDVLVAIGDALGATIPSALRSFSSAAETEFGRAESAARSYGDRVTNLPPPRFESEYDDSRGGRPADTYHLGGAVRRYHLGGNVLPFLRRAHEGLALDEVPIVAQTGEFVMSRRDVANAGGMDAVKAHRGTGQRSDRELLQFFRDQARRDRRERQELANILRNIPDDIRRAAVEASRRRAS